MHHKNRERLGDSMSNKFEDLLNASKLNELVHKKEVEEKHKNCFLLVLSVIGIVASIAAIAYFVYRYFTPDYLDDFDDDYDDFDDNFTDYTGESDSKPSAED